ncbi:M1 family metallopeptidase [Owenweeksia hongkongensis]|uniref:M1 family metallopeptidase n=1 Tax=Owenweeksia hongkongensis TaxID=253245 RepID=UPI003A905143
MKKFLLALLLPSALLAQPGPGYWQQEVKYTMDIDFDVAKHQFSGKQELLYTNNSPDTLNEVFYHLYFNAFQPGSMMDVRSRNIVDPDKRVGDRISKLGKEEIGYHKISMLKQNGQQVNFQVTETVMKVELAEPILPGSTATFSIDFESQVPVQIRRSGRNNAEGIDYTMTQWYPKMAMYDEDGWHPDPYVGREFYADFGTFDVNISIQENFVLGGTGTLTNSEGIWEAKKEKKGITTHEMVRSKTEKRLWKFHAENVHDFAWAADPDYIYKSTVGPDGLLLNFYYLKDYKETWEQLPEHTVELFTLMNKNFGKYAYPQFSVIQGGDGGMEYPMCTMLKGTGKLEGLVGVTVHEAVHNWYYGMLASNENQYPWMDEGFTSFAEAEVLHTMGFEEAENPHGGAYRGNAYMFAKGIQEPLSTPADYFAVNKAYSISAYSRGEMFVSQMRFIVGEEAFSRGMHRYFNAWKFKHPDPKDFLRIMEKESGMQLDWYLNFWMNTSKTQDYAIKEVKSVDRGVVQVELERIGEMPMPVDITFILNDGTEMVYTIPLVSMFGSKEGMNALKPWSWTSPTYTFHTDITSNSVKEVIIDRKQETADLNRENDRYPMVRQD